MRSFQILLACLALAGCATPSEPQPGNSLQTFSGLRQLNDAEIRRLLVGRMLFFVADPGVAMSPHEEIYRSDGTMFVRVDRAGNPGAYRIAGNRICLRFGSIPQGLEECRYLLKAGDGRLFICRSDAGDQRLIRIGVNDQE